MKIVELRQGDRRYEVWAGQGQDLDHVFMHKVYSTNLIERATKKIAYFKQKGYVELTAEVSK